MLFFFFSPHTFSLPSGSDSFSGITRASEFTLFLSLETRTATTPNLMQVALPHCHPKQFTHVVENCDTCEFCEFFLSFFQETRELQLLIIVHTAFQLAVHCLPHSTGTCLLLIFPHFFTLPCNGALSFSVWHELLLRDEFHFGRPVWALQGRCYFWLNSWRNSAVFFGWLGWELVLGFFFGFFFSFWFVCSFSPSHAWVCAIALVIYYACLKRVAFTVFLILFVIGLGICLCGIQISRKLASKHIKVNSV